jgi:tetratricopeptide (TPR) repeat protein
MIHNNLGNVYTALGQTQRACESYERAHDMFVQTYGTEHSSVAMVLNNLGICKSFGGDVEDALATHRRSLAVKERTVGAEHPDCGYSHVNIGDALLQLDRLDEAAASFERGLSVWKASMGVEHPMLAVPMAGLADVAVARDDDEAVTWIETGLRLLPPDRMGSVRARLLFAKARMLHADDAVAAVSLAREAKAVPGLAEDPAVRDALDGWLSKHERAASP